VNILEKINYRQKFQSKKLFFFLIIFSIKFYTFCLLTRNFINSIFILKYFFEKIECTSTHEFESQNTNFYFPKAKIFFLKKIEFFKDIIKMIESMQIQFFFMVKNFFLIRKIWPKNLWCTHQDFFLNVKTKKKGRFF
jgi:hypothetical protein